MNAPALEQAMFQFGIHLDLLDLNGFAVYTMGNLVFRFGNDVKVVIDDDDCKRLQAEDLPKRSARIPNRE